MTSWLRVFGCILPVTLTTWWGYKALDLDGGIHDPAVPMELSSLTSAIRAYEVSHHRYPSEAQGLSVLFKRPVSMPRDESWSPLRDEPPLDPWGLPYQYRRDPAPGAPFGIYSLGVDGVSNSRGNDPDDPNTWDHDKRLPASRQPPMSDSAVLAWLIVLSALGTAVWKWLNHPGKGFTGS